MENSISVQLLLTVGDCDNYTSKLMAEKNELLLEVQNRESDSAQSTESTQGMQAEVARINQEVSGMTGYMNSLPEDSTERPNLLVEISAKNHRKLVLTTRLNEKKAFRVLDKEKAVSVAKATIAILDDTLSKVAARKQELGS